VQKQAQVIIQYHLSIQILPGSALYHKTQIL
jgi:hypothetical protein